MRDILPTEEILLPAKERAMKMAIEEGRVLREVFLAWATGLDTHVETAWFDIDDGIDTRSKP